MQKMEIAVHNSSSEIVPLRQDKALMLGTAENRKAANLLSKMKPEGVTDLAIRIGREEGITVRPEYKTYYPTDEKGNPLPSYRICEVVLFSADVTNQQRRRLLSRLEKLNCPTPSDMFETWLAELSYTVIRRPGSEVDELGKAAAYASRLTEYPADVIKYVLTEHPWKYWPAWVEMKEICDRQVITRRAMTHKLRRLVAKYDAQECV